jgi:EpsI family protein
VGQINRVHIWILIICLGATALLVYRQSEAKPSVKPALALSQALARVDGWKSGRAHPLSSVVVEALKLDDYLFQTYSNGSGTVTLYIGYYHTAKKVGAAHDPMVCYSGQGWQLTQIKQGEFQSAGEGVAYSTMVADQEGSKDLILYWFQAHDEAKPNTFSQKVCIFKQKMLGGCENNAFVRITTPLKDQTEDEACKLILTFVESFYPEFLKYIEGN